ncbi:SNTB1 protein, partial [Pseudoatta argentina]
MNADVFNQGDWRDLQKCRLRSKGMKYLREVTPYFRKASIIQEVGWELQRGFLSATPPPPKSPPRADTRYLPLQLCRLTRAHPSSDPGMKDFSQGRRLLCKLAQGNRKLCEKHFLWVSVYSPENFSKESFPEQPPEISESNTVIAQILIHASSLNSTSNHISVDLKSVRKLELLNLDRM